MSDRADTSIPATQSRTQPLRGKASLCRACGKVFTTTRNFERHRVGGYDIALPDYGRRCLTAEEMVDEGWRVNKYGRWTRERPRLAQRPALESTISPEPCHGKGSPQ